ncbi:MAG TPA: hypothetical protein VN833_04960 [Candidatus Acidoferrales bacterium]|nr:hypothetical protein [Candidatus Acidoferrales bacterium]
MQRGYNFTALAVVRAFAISAQASGHMSQASDLDLHASFAGSTLTCSQTPATIRVPPPLVARAKVKARLVTVLRDSLYDDAKGIVNIAREKGIKKLANKLKRRGRESD